MAEQVSVTAETPVIDTATVSVGTVVNQRTVQEIPLNGRHFVDLGLLIPGSVTPPQNGFLAAPLRGQGSFAFNTAGNREDTVNFMIFNLFNTANYGQPTRIATVGSTSFGVITNTRFPTGDSGSARQVQFAAKVLF